SPIIPFGIADFSSGIFPLPEAINGAGQIVGSYQDNIGFFHGFLMSGGSGVVTTIDVPGAASLRGINDSGEIVGNFGRPFLLSGGRFTEISVPGVDLIEAEGINNLGQIVGSFFD